MALCRDHKRLVEGGCILCGKELCSRCVGRREGVKVYCSMCARRAEVVPRQRFMLEDIKPKTPGQRKLDMPKQGYFDFSKLIKK